MKKGKVQEGRSLDADGVPPAGPAPAFRGRDRRRRQKARVDNVGVYPLDESEETAAGPELVAQEGNGIWLERDVDGLRSSILLDPETGHYTARGIKRRLDELVALSQRNDEALSCVLFGADPVPDGVGVATEALRDAAFEFATVLHQRTRRTDVVGWVEPLKFVVLAPRTPPFGGLRLAERFISMSLSRYVAGEFPITFGAGVAGVEGRTEGLEACPDTLVAAAQRALLDARTAGAAQVAVAWPGV